jgi:glycosyltransferase involved in cell wall biosynthesis
MRERRLTIVIDPILRASRLDQTREFISWAKADGDAVALVTRALTDDERKALPGDVSTHEVVVFPDGFWFGHLTARQVRIVLRACNGILREWQDRSARVFVSGLNELLQPALLAGVLTDHAIARAPMLVVHYDSNVILLRRPSWRRLLSSLHKRLLLSLLLGIHRKLTVCYPDERVVEASSTSRICYKPDPFVHPFRRSEAKRMGGKASRQLTMLFIGRQDERKGVRQVRALEHRLDPDRYRIRVIGPGNDGLITKDGGMQVQNAFVSDEELWEAIGEADYVVLPYSRLFDSASGVFVWSVVAGTPLIVSDHGFLGYMVKKYHLGYVFDDTEATGLAEFLNTSHETLSRPDAYQDMSGNCIEYSERHSTDGHAKTRLRY